MGRLSICDLSILKYVSSILVAFQISECISPCSTFCYINHRFFTQAISSRINKVFWFLILIRASTVSFSLFYLFYLPCAVYFFNRHVHKHFHICQIKSLVGLLLGRCQPPVSVFCCEQGISAFLPPSFSHWAIWTCASGLLLQCLGLTSPHSFCFVCLISTCFPLFAFTQCVRTPTHIHVDPDLTCISYMLAQEVCAAKLIKMTCAEHKAGR